MNSEGTLDRVRERLVSMAPRPWLPDPSCVRLETLSSGAYHDNYRLTCGAQRSVVRVNRLSQWGHTSEQQLAREFATLQDLQESGATPLPLDLLPGDPPLLIETYFEGEPFRYGDQLALAARSFAAVHCQPIRYAAGRIPTGSAQAFLIENGEYWLQQAERGAGQAGPSVRLLRQAARRLQVAPVRSSSPAGIIHTDLIANNLLVEKGRCCILDWEGARLGPVAWDLAYFLSPVTIRWAPAGTVPPSAQERSSFLSQYALAAGVETTTIADAVAQFLPLVIFRALAWCVGFLQTERLTAEATQHLVLLTNPDFINQVLPLA